MTTALGVGVVGLLSDQAGYYIDFVWTKISNILGLIMPNILIGIVYIVFLVPIALLSRIGKNKDPLMLRPEKQTTFKQHELKVSKEYLEKVW